MSVFCAFYKEERFMRIKEYRTELDKDKKNVLCEIGYYDVTEDRFDKPEKIAHFAINQLHLDRRAEEYVYVVGLTTKHKHLASLKFHMEPFLHPYAILEKFLSDYYYVELVLL